MTLNPTQAVEMVRSAALRDVAVLAKRDKLTTTAAAVLIRQGLQRAAQQLTDAADATRERLTAAVRAGYVGKSPGELADFLVSQAEAAETNAGNFPDDLSASSVKPQQVVRTDAIPFTITSDPGTKVGARSLIEFVNDSDGAMGAITWGPEFLLTEGPFTGPASGARKRIMFEWDSSNWVELSRSAGDIT